MERREFIRISSAAALGVAAMGAAGCKSGRNDSASVQEELSNMIQLTPGIGLLGFGAMRWPMIKDGNGKDIIDQEKVNEMVDLALEHGVNYFDTAPVYLQGQSEAATGRALSRHPREDYLLATKLSNFNAPYTYEAGVNLYRKSLENLRTDYIDYYLLHSIGGYDAFRQRFEDNGLMDFVLKEREQGRIRHLGFSFHGSKEGFDSLLALHDKYHWDFVQIQMNYPDWFGFNGQSAEYQYTRLDELGIPVVIMEPLLGGRLASVPAPLMDMMNAMEPGKSAASWAFRFCGSYPRVMTVLSGMTYREHLEENLRTFCHFKPLHREELDLLRIVAKGLRDYHLVGCTGCQYCMPCPYGINIPGIFKFYNNSITEGSYVVSSEQNRYAKVRRQYLASYDRAVESVRQADHCIACGQCIPKCPQHIRIPDELRRINNYIEEVKQEKI